MFDNAAESKWLAIHAEVVKQYWLWESIINLREKEQDMNKSMGHFTNWKFGVPVKVYYHGDNFYSDSRLVDETAIEFMVIHPYGYRLEILSKSTYYYELIPHKAGSIQISPRYPVCITPLETAYCNAWGAMNNIASQSLLLEVIPEPTATLIIDGKEIELNAKCIIAIKEAVRLATGRTDII